MRILAMLTAMWFTIVSSAMAQPREAQGAGGSVAARLMAMDANQDGTLTRAEVTDTRLAAMFDRADGNKDGTLTKDEIEAFDRQSKSLGDGGRGQRGPGEGSRGGPGGDRPKPLGGPGGDRPMRGGPGGGPPRHGTILPGHLQEALKLSPTQREQLAALQKDVDARLAKILTDEQKKQLDEMPPRGPGGPDGPGGPRGERPQGPPRDGAPPRDN